MCRIISVRRIKSFVNECVESDFHYTHGSLVHSSRWWPTASSWTSPWSLTSKARPPDVLGPGRLTLFDSERFWTRSMKQHRRPCRHLTSVAPPAGENSNETTGTLYHMRQGGIMMGYSMWQLPLLLCVWCHCQRPLNLKTRCVPLS